MHWGGVMPWDYGGPRHFTPSEALQVEAYDAALLKSGNPEGKHGR